MWRTRFENSQIELAQARKIIEDQKQEIKILQLKIEEKEKKEGKLREKLIGLVKKAREADEKSD